jgi:hypothetical protein
MPFSVLGFVLKSGKSWLGKFAQQDKWSFCLIAAKKAAEQERR